jgi:hypothetical protein
MLAYLQFSEPLAEVLMQNAAFPMVCGAPLALGDELDPIDPCACANEMPAASAAIAVKVVKVFIGCSLSDSAGNGGTTEQREHEYDVPGTRMVFRKKFCVKFNQKKRPGKVSRPFAV